MKDKLVIQYDSMCVPKLVRITSQTLQLDHTFCPGLGQTKNFKMEDLWRLFKDGVFDDVIFTPAEGSVKLDGPSLQAEADLIYDQPLSFTMIDNITVI